MLQDEQLTFLCILFALIVIGNSLVILTIALSPNRRSRMNIFMMNLAIAGEYKLMNIFVKDTSPPTLHKQTHTHRYTHMHMSSHTLTHAYTHKHTHAHTQTHTSVCLSGSLSPTLRVCPSLSLSIYRHIRSSSSKRARYCLV